MSSGVRKTEYYEDARRSPNIHRLVREGFVFEQDHCERVASHEIAFAEVLQGREWSRRVAYPTILDYAGAGIQTNSIRNAAALLERYQPRLVVCRETAHEAGHQGYEGYLRAARDTDIGVGRLFDWVKQHPYFSRNTAIVIRPDFGRDDEVNEHGQLHHSYGFPSTHRVATIFWGPDFNRGVDRSTVIQAMDMAPTLARLFSVDAIHATGRVVPGLFRTGSAG